MSDEINPYSTTAQAPSGSPFAPSPGEVSEVVHELELDDIIAFNMHHHARSPAVKRLRRFVGALSLFAAVLFTFAGVAAAGGNRPSDAIVLFVMAGVLLVLAPILSGPLQRMVFRRSCRNLLREGSNRAMLGTRRLRISAAGLSQSSELIETNAKWAAVEKIETTAEFAYFYIAAINAYVVPRRAFNDDLQFQTFVELARRYWRQAR